MYALTGVTEFSVIGGYCAKLQILGNSCPKVGYFIVLGDFTANTGTDRNNYSQLSI